MMQLCFDKDNLEKFHFGVKSWFVIKSVKILQKFGVY